MPFVSLFWAMFVGGILLVQTAVASEISPVKVIELTNEARTKEGIGLLLENEKLDGVAQDKIEDMFKHNYFAHFSPQGVSPWHWFDQNGYDYRFAGENLAINFTNAQSQQKAWMDSPTHRKNILNANYAEIGVAVKRGVINDQESTVTVQVFGLQAGQPLPAKPEKQGMVLASADGKNGIMDGVQNGWQSWIIIALILSGAIMVDFVLINRQQHHKTLLIVHH